MKRLRRVRSSCEGVQHALGNFRIGTLVRRDAIEQSVEGVFHFDRRSASGQIIFGGVRERRGCAGDAGDP
jgi:hypothetical protein